MKEQALTYNLSFRRHPSDRWTVETVATDYLQALRYATQYELILKHHPRFELTIDEVTPTSTTRRYTYSH
jgi:hypothetical protein